MRDRLRMVAGSAMASALLTMSMAVPALSAPSCESLVNKAALKFSKARLAKAAGQCGKSAGGSCFTVSGGSVPGKALKKCQAAELQTLFGGKCPVRGGTGCPATVTTADEAAQCLTCSITREVDCLAATIFSRGRLPANCLGSASGAFIDDGDLLAGER